MSPVMQRLPELPQYGGELLFGSAVGLAFAAILALVGALMWVVGRG